MNTEADKCRDKAVTLVREAIKELAKIVIDECEGHDNFTVTFSGKLKESMDSLIKVREYLS